MAEERQKYAVEVEDSTENALEMLGKGYDYEEIVKEIPSSVSGFTPAPDALIKHYGYVTALVWGRIWRYCQMKSGVCYASLKKIADEVGMSERTIIRHVDPLVRDGFLKDMTPDLRNKPHIYADTGKLTIRISVDVTMTESHTGMTKSQPEGDRESVEESNKKQTKKVKERGTPAYNFEGMTVPEAFKVPTLKLYRKATGALPGSPVWEYVHNFITAHNLTEKQIREASVIWCARGYNRGNVEGILEWARDGVPQKNGHKPKADTPEPKQLTPAEIERNKQKMRENMKRMKVNA